MYIEGEYVFAQPSMENTLWPAQIISIRNLPAIREYELQFVGLYEDVLNVEIRETQNTRNSTIKIFSADNFLELHTQASICKNKRLLEALMEVNIRRTSSTSMS